MELIIILNALRENLVLWYALDFSKFSNSHRGFKDSSHLHMQVLPFKGLWCYMGSALR